MAAASAGPRDWGLREKPDIGRNLTALLGRADEAFLTGSQADQERALDLLHIKFAAFVDDQFEADSKAADQEKDGPRRRLRLYEAYHGLMTRRRMWGTRTIGDRV